MEALVQRSALHEALELVFIALDSKSGPKGHTFILFDKDGENIRITGFSPDTIISSFVKATEVPDELALAIPAKPLKEILRKITGETVALKLHEHKTSLRSGRATFKFNNLTRDHFPRIPKVEVTDWQELPTERLLKGFQKVSFSVANDDNHANLKVIHIDDKNFTASDSYRMSIFTNDQLQMGTPISLSRIASGKIVKLLKKLKGDCRVGVCDTTFIIASERAIIMSRITALKYPNYRSVIPSTAPAHAIFDKDELEGALQRLLIVADDTASVEISILNGIATLSSQHGHQGGQEFVECDYDDSIRLKLNGRYLLDVVERLEDSKVKMDIRKDKQTTSGPMPYPLTITEENYVNLIMPRRL